MLGTNIQHYSCLATHNEVVFSFCLQTVNVRWNLSIELLWWFSAHQKVKLIPYLLLGHMGGKLFPIICVKWFRNPPWKEADVKLRDELFYVFLIFSNLNISTIFPTVLFIPKCALVWAADITAIRWDSGNTIYKNFSFSSCPVSSRIATKGRHT